MVALTFQPYAESENQTKLFHHLKTEVTPEGFFLMQQWGGSCKSRSCRGCAHCQVRAISWGEGQVLQVYVLLMQHSQPGTNSSCTHLLLGFWVYVFNINSHQKTRTFEYLKISPASLLDRHTNNVVCGKKEANWSHSPDLCKIQTSQGVTG